MQYSTTTYVMLAAMLVLLWQRKERSLLWYSCFFAFVGIATVYIDFLTFPTLSLAIPLGLLLVLLRDKPLSDRLTHTVACGASWAFGYGGMWAGKWLLGTLFYGPQFFSTEVVDMIAFRVSDSSEGMHYSRMETMWKLLRSCFLTPTMQWVFYALIFVLALLLVWCCVRHKRHYYVQLLPFLPVLCVPFLWVMALCNHNYIHGWFTFRTFVSFIFVLPTALAVVLPPCKPMLSGGFRRKI